VLLGGLPSRDYAVRVVPGRYDVLYDRAKGAEIPRNDGTVIAMLYAPAFTTAPDAPMQPMLAVPSAMIQAGVSRVLANAAATTTPASLTERRGEPLETAGFAVASRRAWLGFGASDLTEPEFLRQLGVDGAVVVDEVFEASPALVAGLEPHDVLLRWGGRALCGVDDLSNALAATAPGSKVDLECVRGLSRRTVQITLGVW